MMELKTNVLYYGERPQTLGKTLRFAQGDGCQSSSSF
jgi:hypothetical protein